MRGFMLRVMILLALLMAVSLAGHPILSSSQPGGPLRVNGGNESKKPAPPSRFQAPLSYRSPGRSHKILVPSEEGALDLELVGSGAARRIGNYGSYSLLEISTESLTALDARGLSGARLRDDLNLIKLRRGQIDTTGPAPAINEDLRMTGARGRSLHLVQLSGPPVPETVRALKATGAKIVSYIPNNSYLIWGSPSQIGAARALKSGAGIVQWDGPYHPAYKLDPSFKLDSLEQIPVSVKLVPGPESDAAVKAIKAISKEVLTEPYETSGMVHAVALVESFRLADIARLPGVVGIERSAKVELNDERANQIVAGPLSIDTAGSLSIGKPGNPGYLNFLSQHGLNQPFDFAVDVGDTGFDKGSNLADVIHPDFRDAEGRSRIAYLLDYTSDFFRHGVDSGVLPLHDSIGHGTLCASIIAGLNTGSGPAFRDDGGYQFGLGMAPLVKVGVSKLFGDDDFFSYPSYAEVTSSAYRSGARISSNSWGTCDTFFGFCNFYNDQAEIYDSLVRDADPAEPGNQSMVIVFSAGNEGNELPSGSVGMPGTAKNVITVGASENFTPIHFDPSDGCEVPTTLTDNALDVVSFSSLGPTVDGRAKPDLVAPGTNIFGAVSQDSFYAGKAGDEVDLCIKYFPIGQTLYTWSSGTSFSAPVVAGGSALAYQWLKMKNGSAPSPALVKALMLNSATYMTGRLGNDNLPGTRQGWGLLSLSRMFETTDRIVYDESPSRTFTQSGGEPFEITGTISDPAKEFRAMLVYTDAAGNSVTNAPLVNQLNLEIVVNGEVYRANNFSGPYSNTGKAQDILNNVQGIRLPPGKTGAFVIRVRPTIIAGDGVPGNGEGLDQDFTLVVTNGSEAPVPVFAVPEVDGLTRDVIVQHSSSQTDNSVVPGEQVSLTIQLKNVSPSGASPGVTASAISNGTASGEVAYPAIASGASSSNLSPFVLRVPANLRCGSIFEVQLRLATEFGEVNLPVRIRVGKASPANTSKTLLFDDLDTRRVKWKLKSGFSIATATGNSGTQSYHAVDKGLDDNDDQLSSMVMKKNVTIPANAGHVRLSFFHIFHFDRGFDGGVAEISTDNGLTWQDLGSRVLAGGYDGRLTATSLNPLEDRLAWTSRGTPGVFSPVVIDLDDFAGQKVKLRFLAGFDLATGVDDGFQGWFIDDIKITADLFSCS
ncbi:MAG TPA: S8 family serine peptidase [Blastocatellia bacterium]|nr:S8 family serine peptidase [Blastocatellia bacterium]